MAALDLYYINFLKLILTPGMDNGRDLRALDYKLEDVDSIFKSFLNQEFINKD